MIRLQEVVSDISAEWRHNFKKDHRFELDYIIGYHRTASGNHSGEAEIGAQAAQSQEGDRIKRGGSVGIVFVILGASIGATLRYLLGSAISSAFEGAFPWGTLVVNLTGCLCIGVLWALAQRWGWSVSARSFVFVGILGAYTTFSSFGIETLRLFQAGLQGQALLYVAASNVAGLGLTWAGFALARHLSA